MHQIFDETNPSKLAEAAEEQIQKYLDCLPKPGKPDKYIFGTNNRATSGLTVDLILLWYY